jgi:4-amino-4-deoxy-L-arabinose transferase-like glycosyltransferase
VWRFRLVALAAFLLGTVLRVVGVGSSDLWLDEAISVFIARKPPLEIIQYSIQSVREHPPGYYLLLHGWLRLIGDSEFSLRAFSLAGSLLFMAVTIHLVRRWFGYKTAALAAIVVAVQPIAVQYARDGRMYSWLMLAMLLTLVALDAALRRNRWRDWAIVAVAAIVSLSIHYLAGLTLVALAIFLLIYWRELPQQRWRFLLVLAVLLGVPTLWILLEPGPRGSALSLLTEARLSAWSPERLAAIPGRWALGLVSDTMALPLALALSSPTWALVAFGIVRMPAAPGWTRGQLRTLFALTLLVPPILGSFVFVYIVPRHFLGTFGLFLIALTVGLADLARRQRLLGGLALAFVIGLSFALSLNQTLGGWRPVSPAIDYIDAGSRPGEPTLYTYFFDWPLDKYYDRRDLPEIYLPPTEADISPDEARAQVMGILQRHPSVWAMLYPGRAGTDLVGRTLAGLAFASEKQWFPGDRAVAHYYAPQPLTVEPGSATWEGQFRLVDWAISGLTGETDPTGAPVSTVSAGDALRLQFDWQPTGKIQQPLIVALTLVGPDGQIWAERRGEPCNWTCPTSDWTDQTLIDRQAFEIPADVPPGEYGLRLGWLTPSGERVQATADGKQTETVALATVRVDSPGSDSSPARPLPARVTTSSSDGSLRLLSAQLPAGPLRVGARLSLPLQWAVGGPLPGFAARLKLAGPGGAFSVAQPLGPAWYGNEQWQPGNVTRVLPGFDLPATMAPGSYRLTLEVAPPGEGTPAVLSADLGDITITDRERSFAVPADGQAIDAQWQEGVRLARYSLPEKAAPGERINVRLAWVAGRAASRNWKVFIHVRDATGNVPTQGDAYPGLGLAPATTWREGEVLVDDYPIELPTGLPAGEYEIALGLYDQPSDQRLPMLNGGDTLTLPVKLKVTR